MSLCFCSLLKPSNLIPEPDLRFTSPNRPRLPPVRLTPLNTVKLSHFFKAINDDTTGVITPDDAVTGIIHTFELVENSDDNSNGELNGAVIVDEIGQSETLPKQSEKEKKKKKKEVDDDLSNRFKLRNGKEILEEKAYVIGVERKGGVEDSFSVEDSLSELSQLADTAGLVVVGSTYQK